MNSSNDCHPYGVDETAINPIAPNAANEREVLLPRNDKRQSGKAGMPDREETDAGIQVTRGQEANEDETSEGWADRGGV